MRRLLITALCLVLSLSGCGEPQAKELSGEELHIFFATDLHHFAPSLYEDSPLFLRAIEQGDGKVAHYSTEIIRTLLAETLEYRPDALVLGGDLTLNGELESHRDLAEMLAEVKQAGIPVLVIPGNHDINRTNARRYNVDTVESTEQITPEGFWELYSPLGAEDAASRDDASLSYCYPLSEDLWLLMLDTSIYDDEKKIREDGKILPETLAWMEARLEEAEREGAAVVTVSHHNLLRQNPLFEEGYTIHNNRRVTNLLDAYGVPLNLSGHIHAQHIIRSREDHGLYDIATNALAVYPNLYGQLDIGESITYQARPVDVAAWAKKQKLSDPNLLDFPQYSRDFFSRGSTGSKTEKIFQEYGISPEEQEEMLAFASEVNLAYFSGTLSLRKEEMESHPGYLLWKEKCPWEFFTYYFDILLEEEVRDHTELVLENFRER